MYDNIITAVEQIKEVFNAEAVYIFGVKYKAKAEFAGGLVLILMGLKILLEH